MLRWGLLHWAAITATRPAGVLVQLLLSWRGPAAAVLLKHGCCRRRREQRPLLPATPERAVFELGRVLRTFQAKNIRVYLAHGECIACSLVASGWGCSLVKLDCLRLPGPPLIGLAAHTPGWCASLIPSIPPSLLWVRAPSVRNSLWDPAGPAPQELSPSEFQKK